MVTPQMVLRGAIARAGVRPFPLSLTYEVTWLCTYPAVIATVIHPCATS